MTVLLAVQSSVLQLIDYSLVPVLNIHTAALMLADYMMIVLPLIAHSSVLTLFVHNYVIVLNNYAALFHRLVVLMRVVVHKALMLMLHLSVSVAWNLKIEVELQKPPAQIVQHPIQKWMLFLVVIVAELFVAVAAVVVDLNDQKLKRPSHQMKFDNQIEVPVFESVAYLWVADMKTLVSMNNFADMHFV
jgi:hypothetical protein